MAYYVSEFKDDKYHGQGRSRNYNRDIYSGKWKDGKKHGYGVLAMHNGEKYVGALLTTSMLEKRGYSI